MDSSSELRQRNVHNTRKEQVSQINQSELKTKPVEISTSKVRGAEHQFYLLTLSQLAFGGLFFGTLYSIFNFDSLKKYREIASWFVDLQYKTSWGTAHAGVHDIYYVISAFIALISLRAGIQLILYLAISVRRDLDVKTKVRFTEQAWCIAYYGGAAIAGVTLLRSQPYGWNAGTLWVGFPHYYIDPKVKQYYLTLMSFWFTQVFIIHIESRRKDHYQMLTHHFVTCALVVGSYVWSYTRIGHLVLIMMDTVDVFLSLAKCSKYLKAPKALTDGFFMLFLITWVLLRHFVYMYEMVYGAFPALDDLLGSCVFDPQAKSLYAPPIQCFSAKAHYTFFALAMILQGITIFWLVMILKIVVSVVRGDGADDTRSDSEDD